MQLTINPSNRFGYGNHACPGRFMGIRIIKIILSRMLIEFDISWDRTNGEPPRFTMEGLSVPSPTQPSHLNEQRAFRYNRNIINLKTIYLWQKLTVLET